MIFNETTLYKNMNVFNFDSVGELTKKNELVELEENIKEDVAERIQDDLKNIMAQPQPSTPQLKRPIRISRPLERYSPSLYYQ